MMVGSEESYTYRQAGAISSLFGIILDEIGNILFNCLEVDRWLGGGVHRSAEGG